MNEQDRRRQQMAAYWTASTEGFAATNTPIREALQGPLQDVVITHEQTSVQPQQGCLEVMMRLGVGHVPVTWRATFEADPQVSASFGPLSEPLAPGRQAGVLADRLHWGMDEVSQVVNTVTAAVRDAAATAHAHVAARSIPQLQDELTKDYGPRFSPSTRQVDALSRLVEQHARLQAELAINEAYVRLAHDFGRPTAVSSDGLANQMASPQVAIDDDLAELLSEHWDHTYKETVDQAFQVTAALDTPGEQAMFEREAEQEFYRLHGLSYPQSPAGEPPGPSLPPPGPHGEPDRNRGGYDHGPDDTEGRS